MWNVKCFLHTLANNTLYKNISVLISHGSYLLLTTMTVLDACNKKYCLVGGQENPTLQSGVSKNGVGVGKNVVGVGKNGVGVGHAVTVGNTLRILSTYFAALVS